MSEPTLREARAEDADVLTEIAHAAKAHWGYPAAWIESWREQLTLTAEFVERHTVVVVEDGGRVRGFFALCVKDDGVELEHLWVLPSEMGRGFGRVLLERAVSFAREAGAGVIGIDSDPYAEAFYLHMGARPVGRTPAPVEGDPERYLPRLELRTDS